MKDLPRELRTAVKPDLNLIYTEPPFELPSERTSAGSAGSTHSTRIFLAVCWISNRQSFAETSLSKPRTNHSARSRLMRTMRGVAWLALRRSISAQSSGTI